MRADMNIASYCIFPFSLQTTPRIRLTSLLPLPLGHWVPHRHLRWGRRWCRRVRSNGWGWGMLTCAVVEIADGPNVTSGYWSLRLHEWDEIHFVTETVLQQASSKIKTSIVTHREQSMNIRMPCETRCIIPSATAVHQNPTWNNQRWFFNVLLCHRKFRFTHGLAFKVCDTILQNLPSLSSA